MTPDQLDLAKRLVACSQWRWVPGMREHFGCRRLDYTDESGEEAWWNPDRIEIVQYVWPAHRAHDGSTPFLPDLSDYATAAILLRLAMEANCEVAYPPTAELHHWAIYGDMPSSDPDLGTASARALLSVWSEE